GDVNEHWHIQIRTFLPDRIEFGIVHFKPGAIVFIDVQPEILEYLQTYCAGLYVFFELPGCALTEARTNIAEVDVGEEHHAIGIGTAFDYRKPAAQILSPAPAEIDDQPDIELIHRLHHFLVLLRGDRSGMMAVDVN